MSSANGAANSGAAFVVQAGPTSIAPGVARMASAKLSQSALLGRPRAELVRLVADLEADDIRRTLAHDVGRLCTGGGHVAQLEIDAVDGLAARGGQEPAELVDAAGGDLRGEWLAVGLRRRRTCPGPRAALDVIGADARRGRAEQLVKGDQARVVGRQRAVHDVGLFVAEPGEVGADRPDGVAGVHRHRGGSPRPVGPPGTGVAHPMVGGEPPPVAVDGPPPVPGCPPVSLVTPPEPDPGPDPPVSIAPVACRCGPMPAGEP